MASGRSSCLLMDATGWKWEERARGGLDALELAGLPLRPVPKCFAELVPDESALETAPLGDGAQAQKLGSLLLTAGRRGARELRVGEVRAEGAARPQCRDLILAEPRPLDDVLALAARPLV